MPGLEAIGQAPPPERWPPKYEDLPYEAQEALRLFNSLPTRVSGMAGYTGKDLGPLEVFFNIYEVPEESKRVVLDLISYIINVTVDISAKKMKANAERNKPSTTKNIRK